jgi:hypothetical protein
LNLLMIGPSLQAPTSNMTGAVALREYYEASC